MLYTLLRSCMVWYVQSNGKDKTAGDLLMHMASLVLAYTDEGDLHMQVAEELQDIAANQD
jgi:hypothetical protein